MSSQSTTIKPKVSLFKKVPNYCEINLEYPILQAKLNLRHLGSCEKSTKNSQSTNDNKLSYSITTEHQDYHEKDSNKHSKNQKEEIEIIELFQFKSEEEINDKFYRKRRYRSARKDGDNDEEKRDNTN